ncbi:MAG: barstar family protein [Paracoccus sp. (in: a-proteobacteria)]
MATSSNEAVRPVELVLDLHAVNSLEDFQKLSSALFGFPDFYGNNMRAWVDCVRSIRDPDEGLTKFFVKKNEILVLKIVGFNHIEKNVPELVNLLFWAIAACNASEAYIGRPPILTCSF